MNWYVLEKKYVKYLKQFDDKVPDVEYNDRLKCFLGIIIIYDSNVKYFAPLTSYKKKFDNLKSDVDLFKIVDDKGKIYGAINLNNMLPVPDGTYHRLTLSNLDEYRKFENARQKKEYWKLLQKEMLCINEEIINKDASKLLHIIKSNKNSVLSRHCCNFSLLEEKCKEYFGKNKN